MASSTGNIKQAYAVNGDEIYPKVILDALEGEGGITGIEVIKEAIGGMGMENLKGVSVEYEDDGSHHLVFKSHYEESAGGYLRETVVNEGPLIIGKYSETNPYADDHVYVSKNLTILEDINALEFAADADAVNGRVSGKIAHKNNSMQIINYDKTGKLELFGGGEVATECVSISASSMSIPKDVSISKKLNVSGNTTVATTSGATLFVGGDATFSKTITVDGKSRFKNDVSLDGQTAFRGSSPKLSFTSYENKLNSTNRATGYIVEHYGTSNNTSLEMYDGTENNAHLSLSGSDKTFTVKVNANNSLILDGSNKVAKIQPYSSAENSPSLIIDGLEKTTTLKSDNNTKLMLDAINKCTVLYGDSNRYMELNGADGEINLNASENTETYLKLYGNGSIDLQADDNRYLYMPSNSTTVSLCADGQGLGDTCLLLDGSTSHPYIKLSALSDMHLGMNESSGNLTLQAKEGTYLKFDVSGNKKSAELNANDNYYLKIDANKEEAKLYAGSVTGLHLNNSGEEHDVNLCADNETYIEAHTYVDTDDDDSPYKVNEIRLTCGSTNDNYIHIKDDTTFSENTYIELKSGNAKLCLDATQAVARLSAYSTDFIQIDGDILLHRSNTSTLTVGDSVVGSSIPMTAKVNDVSNVYLGCPIGTVVMWAGLTPPDGWLLCDGGAIALKSPYTEGVTVDSRFKDYQRLVNVIKNKYGGSTGVPTAGWVTHEGTIQGAPYVSIPDLRQKFPLGAKDGSLNNGYNSSGNKIEVNTSLGKTGGDSSVILSVKTMPSHSHTVNMNLQVVNDRMAGAANDAVRSFSTQHFTINNTGGDLAHSNMPPYLAINFIIKYK